MNQCRRLMLAVGAMGAMTLPLTAVAQPQGRLWRVGFVQVRGRPPSIETDFIGGFVQGLKDRGYIEGKNLTIEWRFAGGDVTRIPALAADLVQAKVDVLVGFGPQAVRAMKQATETIPIVMVGPGDPVLEGFVDSLARPGGNLTGPTTGAGIINVKRLQMLQEISPRLARIAVVFNSTSRTHVGAVSELQAAADKFKVQIVPAEARSVQEIEPALSTLKRDKAQAIIVLADGIFNGRTSQFADFALQERLPLIAPFREFAESGCLMSYGVSFHSTLYRAAYFVDRILKGAKPADLPVEDPTTFELVLNGRTAKALGLKIPQSLLVSADRVID
jgi:putative tryptophan/tyrosine transport system substrate-binding protein